MVFPTLQNKLIGYDDDSTLIAVVQSGVRVALALESQLQSPWTANSAWLVSGVTFGDENECE